MKQRTKDQFDLIIIGNGIKAEEQGFLKNAGVPDQETQVIHEMNKNKQKHEIDS